MGNKYVSLRIKSGRGGRLKLRNLEEVVHSQLEVHNPNLNNILDYLKEQHKVIEKIGYSWRRVRRSLKNKHNPAELDLKQHQITYLQKETYKSWNLAKLIAYT